LMPTPVLLLPTGRPDGRRVVPANGLTFTSGQSIFYPTEPPGVQPQDRTSSVRLPPLPHGDFSACNRDFLFHPRPDLISTDDRWGNLFVVRPLHLVGRYNLPVLCGDKPVFRYIFSVGSEN
jgi:hypothetical protein